MQHIQEILESITDPGMREVCAHLWQTVQQHLGKNEAGTAVDTVEDTARKDELVEGIASFPVQWPDGQRGIPSALLRSALFGVVRRGRRRALEREILASWPDAIIRYTGFRLDQADLDVYLEILHLAMRHGFLGAKITCSASAILRSIGRHTGKSDHEWLKRVMNRLGGFVEITVKSIGYAGPLVQEFYYDDESGRWMVQLNAKLARLFCDNYTLLSIGSRHRLRGDLAKWLHGYVCSHKATPTQPHRIGLTKLQELCGAEVTAGQRKWRQEVKQAMTQLERLGIVAFWQIVNDVLEFVRPPKSLPG